jgi:hypothetical protein
MKNLKLFVFAVAFFTLNVVSAANLNPINPTDELRVEINDLIGSSYMDEMSENEYSAEVVFTVNSKSELIVLSVNSDNSHLKTFLKNKLNYKKVDHKPGKPGEIFLLPVKMIKQI